MGRLEQKTIARRVVGKLARMLGGAPFESKLSPETDVAGSIDDDRGQLHELGFHGDAYLLALIDRLLPFVDGFIETGANLGSTTRYVADRFSGLTVLSCEPGDEAAAEAARNVADYSNATVYSEFSPDFLHHVFTYAPQLNGALNCHFLDAHGHGFKWPLADEIAFITRQQCGVIIVDDCRVPDRPEFKYSKYAGQECCLEYIEAALDPRHEYDVVFPDYQDRTSQHHALSGYVLIAFGTPLLQQAINGDRKFKHITLPRDDNQQEAA